MEQSCKSQCQGRANDGGSLLEAKERAVFPTHFLEESQHVAQLSREQESKVQMIHEDTKRKIKHLQIKKNEKYFLHMRKEDFRSITMLKKTPNNNQKTQQKQTNEQ